MKWQEQMPGEGVDVVVVYNAWRDEILSAEQKQDVETLFPSSFMEVPAGFRVRRIIAETTCEAARRCYARSAVYLANAEFPELGRVILS
jgi:hypothetical protein